MKSATISRSFVAAFVASTLAFSNIPATAADVKDLASLKSNSTAGASIPADYGIDEFETDLEYLETLSDEELENILNKDRSGIQPRVAPLVIVAAIGCAVSGGSAIFATDWEDANSVAWTLAGALTSCIPGVAQAKLVTTILKHKETIGRALKAVGAVSAGSVLTGDSPQQ